MLNSNEIKKIHEIELEALKAFLNFCNDNNITVFLRGGSVMGAVKYKGFIPWDDDIDVAIPREDYKRLILNIDGLLLDNKFCFHYWLLDNSVHSYFPWLMLTEDERKLLGLKANTDKGFHIIDIIPLDGSPNNKWLRKLYLLYIYILRAIASTNTFYHGAYKDPHTKKQQLIIKALRLLRINKLFPQKLIYEKLDRILQKYSWKESEFCGTMTASLGSKECLDSLIWGDGILADFDGITVKIPSKYDDYLKIMYGENYLNYTPKNNERKSHFGEE